MQQPTIGFLKAPRPSTSLRDDELPSGWRDLFSRFEEQDYFDPRVVAGLCGIGVVALPAVLYLMNPAGALVVFGACSVLTAVIIGVLNGGSA